MSELYSNLWRLFVAKQREPAVLCGILLTDFQFMLYPWSIFSFQSSDCNSLPRMWIASAFLDLLVEGERKRSQFIQKQVKSVKSNPVDINV